MSNTKRRNLNQSEIQTQGLRQQGQQPHRSSGPGATSIAAAHSSEAAASTLGAAAVFRVPTTTVRSSLSSQGPLSRADDPVTQLNDDVSGPEMNLLKIYLGSFLLI